MAMVAMVPGAAVIIVPIIVVAIIVTVVIVIVVGATCAINQLQILLIEIEGGGLLDRRCALSTKYAKNVFHDVLTFLLLCDYFL